ncbi:MAG: DNA translocase FtsK 4TM domain-containing protein [Ignavibacteriales bacterium]|nr:DNA translocase FtsK 4TM domain-containing protein [Ignavibacteriales bacterium]
MAKKKNKSSENHSNDSSSYYAMSSEKFRKILGLFVFFLSIFLFLSIISYSRSDEDSLTGLFDNLFSSGSDNISNWMGIVGAYFSDFFVHRIFGYFSLIIPILLFAWGIHLFNKFDLRILLHSTNFSLLAVTIITSIFGLLANNLDILSETHELSGKLGAVIGSYLGNQLGSIGGLILLLALAATLLIIAFDINIEKLLLSIVSIFRMKDDAEIDEGTQPDKEGKSAGNIEKIKKLADEKPKKGKLSKAELTAEQLMEAEAEEQTRIRIIRKDDQLTSQETNEVLRDEVKKVNLEKVGELPDKKTLDENIDEKLPDPWEEIPEYKNPSLDLLEPVPEEDFKVAEEELKKNAELLKEKLKLFDIEIKDISVTPGPVVTLYEIVPSPGVKISKIVGLENDIALALAARGIRIIAPIPGKGAIGVEIPNAESAIVKARSVLAKINESTMELPMSLGKTISGDVYLTDLSKMPHLLIAGSTGSGKSVGINMIITSLLFAKKPSEVKLIMIDPKKIELSLYNKLRKHYLAVSPDLDEEIITVPQNAVILLKSVEMEMEQRYDKLAKLGVRNIVDYNKKVASLPKKPADSTGMKHHHLPYLVVIVDELADLMITAGKEVEEPITRLAQLARAVGVQLVLATQRPSVNVITGVIKANFSARIAYQVATKIDSRTILDMNGAEQLLGKGDMLFLPTGSPKPNRIQNAFISTEEVEKITNFINQQSGYSRPYFLPSIYEKKRGSGRGFLADLDPMFEDAARVIVRYQQGSVSLLQRKLKLGYSRAARIVDQLEEAGVVGPNDGSKARTVLIENDEQLETVLRSL